MTSQQSPVRVAVTGAAGQIGYSLVFRIASGAMLGPDTPVALQLLEITPALGALEGVRMELDDCAFPLLTEVVPTDDPDTAFGDADVAHYAGDNGDHTRGLDAEDGLDGAVRVCGGLRGHSPPCNTRTAVDPRIRGSGDAGIQASRDAGRTQGSRGPGRADQPSAISRTSQVTCHSGPCTFTKREAHSSASAVSLHCMMA